MSLAKEALIGAGTTLAFEDPENAGTYLDLIHATSIGSVGKQPEFVETTSIASKDRTFTKGMNTPADKQITLNDVPGDAVQDKFLKLADVGETLKMRVTYTTGRVGKFSMVTGGYMVNEPQNNSTLTVTVYAKQSGSTEWGITTS